MLKSNRTEKTKASSTFAVHIWGPIRLDSVMTFFSATDDSPHCIMYNIRIQEVQQR